jgi:hypothetical protein
MKAIGVDSTYVVTALYWPVAADLSMKGGFVVVGPETARACKGIYKHHIDSNIGSFIVVPAAGVPKDSTMKQVPMCDLTAEYLRGIGVHEKKIHPHAAETFNTQGEAKVIAGHLLGNPSIKTVFISVKWWHALRSYIWLWIYMKKFNIRGVDVCVLSQVSCVEPKAILHEFFLAIPFNLPRMMKVLLIG